MKFVGILLVVIALFSQLAMAMPFDNRLFNAASADPESQTSGAVYCPPSGAQASFAAMIQKIKAEDKRMFIGDKRAAKFLSPSEVARARVNLLALSCFEPKDAADAARIKKLKLTCNKLHVPCPKPPIFTTAFLTGRHTIETSAHFWDLDVISIEDRKTCRVRNFVEGSKPIYIDFDTPKSFKIGTEDLLTRDESGKLVNEDKDYAHLTLKENVPGADPFPVNHGRAPGIGDPIMMLSAVQHNQQTRDIIFQTGEVVSVMPGDRTQISTMNTTLIGAAGYSSSMILARDKRGDLVVVAMHSASVKHGSDLEDGTHSYEVGFDGMLGNDVEAFERTHPIMTADDKSPSL